MPALSGIVTGTRAERLERLLQRARHELDSARRRDDRHETARLELLLQRCDEALAAERSTAATTHAATPAGLPLGGPSIELRALADLGVTARDVKLWAVSAGLLDAVHRGRVKHDLVLAYADAHRQETPNR